MAERGDYRGIYTVLGEDPDFQALGPDAQLVWFHLKLKLGASGIDVLHAAEAVLAERMGMASGWHEDGMAMACGRVADALSRLQSGGWLIRDGSVLWLRNALKYEPSRMLSVPNHRKSILAHIAGLPKRSIVNDFARFYELPIPFPELTPSATHEDGIGMASRWDTLSRETRDDIREDERRDVTEASLRTRTRTHAREGNGQEPDPREDPPQATPQVPAEPDRFTLWMGPEMERLGSLDPMTRLALVGLYGPNGTDERLWNGVPEADRPRLACTAMLRWQGENHRAFNSRLFREILKTVIADGENDARDNGTPSLSEEQHRLYLDIRKALEECGMEAEQAAEEAMQQVRESAHA